MNLWGRSLAATLLEPTPPLRRVIYEYADGVREIEEIPNEEGWVLPMLAGFKLNELLDLRRALMTAGVDLDEAIVRVLRVDLADRLKEKQEREWREHFGILCDLFPPEEPEDDTPYLKCAVCDFKVILPWHSTDAMMRHINGKHKIVIGHGRL